MERQNVALALTRERIEETVTQYVYLRPITFDEWLETGDTVRTELVNGTPVEMPLVQLDHEKLNLWLLHVLGNYSAMFTPIYGPLGASTTTCSACSLGYRRGAFSFESPKHNR